MNLPIWLQKVAAAVNHELKPLTAEVYLEELVKWRLTDEQWELLRSRAKLRLPYFPGRLPGLPELAELRDEILQEAAARESARKTLERPPDAVECPQELKPRLRKFGIVK